MGDTLYRRNTIGIFLWSDADCWSLTSGGGATGHVPTSADDVIFDASSANMTIGGVDAACNSINTDDFESSKTLTIYSSRRLTIGSQSDIDFARIVGIDNTSELMVYGASFTGSTALTVFIQNAGIYSGTIIGDGSNTALIDAGITTGTANLSFENISVNAAATTQISSWSINSLGGTCTALINDNISIDGGGVLVFTEDLRYNGEPGGCDITDVTITGSTVTGNAIYAIGSGVVNGGGNTNWVFEISPPTTITETIGTNSRDYAIISDWNNATKGLDLVTLNQIRIGECYNDSDFQESTVLAFDGYGEAEVGVGRDSTHYRKLTVAEGDRHLGSLTAGANLEYVSPVSTTYDIRFITITEPYFKMEWLRIHHETAHPDEHRLIVIDCPGSSTAKNITLNALILHDWICTDLVDSGDEFRAINITDNGGCKVFNCYITNFFKNNINNDSGDMGGIIIIDNIIIDNYIVNNIILNL